MQEKEQHYQRLCAAVMRIDRKAGMYLNRYAKQLKSFRHSHHLADAFIWKDTAYGHEFWLRISRKVHVRPECCDARAVAYEDLCNRVAQFDNKAAVYMRSQECHNLPTFNKSAQLLTAFYWTYTPQGDSYWRNLSCKLGGQ